MNVTSLIDKLDEVIKVIKSIDIEVNLGNIYGVLVDVAERINFLEDEKKGYPMMLNLLKNVNAKLENTNKGIKLLSNQYGELARSIAIRDKTLIQNIGNLVNQQKAVIEESNRYWNRIETHL